MLFSPQIPLPLEPRQNGRFSDFVVGSNGAVVNAVKDVVNSVESSLFLAGSESSGKTHLLNAACLGARDQGMTAFYMGLKALPADGARSLEGLEGMDLVCVDDVHTIAGNPAWEEALFHFINRHRASAGRMLVSSRCRLSQLNLGLPDLASRLAWGLRLELQTLDEKERIRVMVQSALRLGYPLPPDVADYILRHGRRDLASLVSVTEQLQKAAFAEKRKITVPLARKVLKSFSDQ